MSGKRREQPDCNTSVPSTALQFNRESGDSDKKTTKTMIATSSVCLSICLSCLVCLFGGNQVRLRNRNSTENSRYSASCFYLGIFRRLGPTTTKPSPISFLLLVSTCCFAPPAEIQTQGQRMRSTSNTHTRSMYEVSYCIYEIYAKRRR